MKDNNRKHVGKLQTTPQGIPWITGRGMPGPLFFNCQRRESGGEERNRRVLVLARWRNRGSSVPLLRTLNSILRCRYGRARLLLSRQLLKRYVGVSVCVCVPFYWLVCARSLGCRVIVAIGDRFRPLCKLASLLLAGCLF